MTPLPGPPQLPASLLVANRGEIASRIIRTARRLGIRTTAVYTDADLGMPYVSEADDSVLLTVPRPADAYLDGARLVEVALADGIAAVHPGYGFLSEDADFARMVQDSGLLWIGPSPEAMQLLGDKIRARSLAASIGVPIAGPGGAVATLEEARAEVVALGYPVILKPAAGGGGIGMCIVESDAELASSFGRTQERADRTFGSARILIEAYWADARHVEVQLLGLSDGTIQVLGDRDCSVQRRHQKVVEESPAPDLPAATSADMRVAARRIAEAAGYRGAGTVEFLVDNRTGAFTFLEVNTRIQVEHPVTELVYGIDLVEQQLLIACEAPVESERAPQGHALEFRIYAERPHDFLPAPGEIETLQFPQGTGIRVDSGYASGTRVTPHFDPLIAKLCVHAPDRRAAVERARAALAAVTVEPVVTNLPFLRRLLEDEEFVEGAYNTSIAERVRQQLVRSREDV